MNDSSLTRPICLKAYKLQGSTTQLHTHEPTINNNAIPSNIITRRTSQENNRTGQIHRHTPAFRRHAAHNVVIEVLVLRIRGILFRHWGPEVTWSERLAEAYNRWGVAGLALTWMNAITLNPLLRPFIRHGFRNLEYAAFTGCVRRDVLAADEGDD